MTWTLTEDGKAIGSGKLSAEDTNLAGRESGTIKVPYRASMPEEKKLIFHEQGVDAVCKMTGADSLAFLSSEGMVAACPDAAGGFCMACFNGDYPTK